MCTGDLGFTAAKKYDLEVWIPSYGTYRKFLLAVTSKPFKPVVPGIRFRRDPRKTRICSYVERIRSCTWTEQLQLS